MRVSPENGARILSFQSKGADGPIDWLHPLGTRDFDHGPAPKGGLFLLAPFSNRMRGASLSFRGTEWPLAPHPNAGSDAMHGAAALQPWIVRSASAREAILHLPDVGGGWPWPTSLRFQARLVDGALELDLSARNEGTQDAPIGLGFHPYFARRPDARIAFEATHEWDVGDDNRPGDGHAVARGHVDRAVCEQPLARFYRGVGDVALEYPQLRASLTLSCSPTLAYWLAFAPPDLPYFCFEPVSHLTGALELPEAEASRQGMVVLRPSEVIRATMRFEPTLQLRR